MKYILLMAASSALWLFPVALNASDIPSHYNPCGKSEYSYSGADAIFESNLTLGIPWPAWMDLLNQHWAQQEVQSDALYDPTQVMRFIRWAVPAEKLPPDYGHLRHGYVNQANERYEPSVPATGRQTEAYNAAADLYRSGNWKESIPLFDVVTADKSSPYRAAAAYTAARAALNQGLYQNAVNRIAKLTTDSSLHEYQLPAFHLIGTIAYLSGSPELIAAHFAEIEHLFEAPPSIVCHDALALDIIKGTPSDNEYHQYGEGGWQNDLSWYLESSFPYLTNHGPNKTRRNVLDTLASHDPLIDVLRTLAAPTRFNKPYGWLLEEISPIGSINTRSTSSIRLKLRYYRQDWEFLALKDSLNITNHAREEWKRTKNPLWGYGLAQRTADVSDLPLLQDMLATLPTLAKSPAISYAKEAFQEHFIRHIIRLQLINGKLEEALKFLRDHPIDKMETGWNHFDNRALLNGGIRLFLEKFDLSSARRWASEAGRLLPQAPIDSELRPLLANNFAELLGGKVPGDNRSSFYHENYNTLPFQVIDLLPTKDILELAGSTGISDGTKRVLLSSAWLRIYVLLGWQSSLNMLPQLRAAFPELATDIDDINGAWLLRHKSHLLTRMLLRVPGFNFRPSWTRPASQQRAGYGYTASGRGIFDIDGHNPNDGNWWCAADVNQIKVDMAETFFVQPLNGGFQRNYGLYHDPLLPIKYGNGRSENYTADMVSLADKLIAWHPLLKKADNEELQKLSNVEDGPELLSKMALMWVQQSNWLTRPLGLDKYLPETLHFAVRSTRYGCRRDGSNKVYSRNAYIQLHKLFPISEWTRKTPYWFDYTGYVRKTPR